VSDADRAPIHLLHVINTLDVGGAERMLVKLIAGLDPAVYHNTIVTLTGEGHLNAAARDAGATVHELGMVGARDFPRAAWRLRRIVKTLQPDIVQSWLYQADLLATLAAGAAPRARRVWTIRCTDMALERYRRSTAVVLWLLARLSHRPDLILANSRVGLDWHLTYGYRPRAQGVIPNGFDLTRFRPNPAAGRIVRAELGIPEDAPVVGTVARVDPMKDYGTFLGAVAQLADAIPELHVIVIGKDTETLAAPSTALEPRLHRLGVRDDVERLLPALDVFCLASAFGEGFPNVLGEAMACGLPAVVTEVGDAAAVLGTCGRTVAPGDPGALAAALLDLLRLDRAARAAIGTDATARIAQHYEIGHVVQQFAATYDGLTEMP
jgi:glycosyltransferase involved in cell wall biosynthesis